MVKQPLNNPWGSDTFSQMETKTRSVFFMTCVYKAKRADFPLNHPERFQSCACKRRRATGRKKEVTYWRKAQCRGRADGNGGRSREPQVRGRQPHSSELITPSISLSDPERKEGGQMEQLALRWPRGEES